MIVSILDDDVYQLLEVCLIRQFVPNGLLCRFVHTKPVVTVDVVGRHVKVLQQINKQIVSAAFK